MSAPPQVTDTPVPPPTSTVGIVATVDQSRDLVAEKQQEQQADRAAAAKKLSRFQARRVTSLSAPVPPAPEFENLILKAAVNNPLADLADFSASTFVPDLGPAFYILYYMDHTMAFTKRWTDNCMGWVPPISQMYISVLVYVQIFRAMDAAGLLTPGSSISNFLVVFINVFPLAELWIPGPLVSLFRNISAFWPSADDQFGNVSPIVPATPLWSADTEFSFGQYNARNVPSFNLPNISAFLSRLRSITTVATAQGMTQSVFTNHINGPNHCSTIFGATLDDTAQERLLFSGPGLSFAYPDNLALWQNAASALPRLSVPADLSLGANPSAPDDDWSTFLRFAGGEHVWFGPVSAIMAKYCQFFNGSQSMDSIAPNCSAAASVKLRNDTTNNIHTPATFVARSGTGDSREHGNNNAEAHRTLRNSARATFNSRVALKEVPDVSVYAAITYGINSYSNVDDQQSARLGNFWSLGPDVKGRDNLEVLPGVLSTITREYHSDTRIIAQKQ